MNENESTTTRMPTASYYLGDFALGSAGQAGCLALVACGSECSSLLLVLSVKPLMAQNGSVHLSRRLRAQDSTGSAIVPCCFTDPLELRSLTFEV